MDWDIAGVLQYDISSGQICKEIPPQLIYRVENEITGKLPAVSKYWPRLFLISLSSQSTIKYPFVDHVKQ